jgi:gamma-glutamyltranspeptidase/glutathione hydrolase
MRRSLGIATMVILILAMVSGRPSAGAFVGRPVRARHGLVASTHEVASRVGVEILQRGGNAVDAAVAVALALAVVHPAAGNLGGGGFMLIRMADGRTTVIDYRETAPARAHRDLYLDQKGDLIPDASTVGHRAVAVPGTVAGLALALEKYGTMSWADVCRPAERLARDGVVLTHFEAESLKRAARLLSRFPESRRIFLRDGRYYEEGELFRQPDLAETFRRLIERGPREFYEGETARRIVAEMEAGGGLITLDDLKDYRAVEREPLRTTYRGYEILTVPPPSSGGVALIEMLHILEGFDLRALGHNSADYVHLLVEAMRRAFADRARFLGDPDFARIPVKGLTSRRYAEALRRTIDLARATPSATLTGGDAFAYESEHTTHFSVVDAAGNVVANTYTLNGSYGSGVTVRGAGFLLNNEMDDFTSKPGAPNMFGLLQSEANQIAPRKRPLSAMTPTIVLKDGKPFLVLGSPGGPTIINTVLQVILNVIDFGMNLQQALAMPRVHHQWMPDQIVFEPFGLSRDTIQALTARGHTFAERPRYMGDVQAIMIEPETGVRLGASDPRMDGKPVGY